MLHSNWYIKSLLAPLHLCQRPFITLLCFIFLHRTSNFSDGRKNNCRIDNNSASHFAEIWCAGALWVTVGGYRISLTGGLMVCPIFPISYNNGKQRAKTTFHFGQRRIQERMMECTAPLAAPSPPPPTPATVCITGWLTFRHTLMCNIASKIDSQNDKVLRATSSQQQLLDPPMFTVCLKREFDVSRGKCRNIIQVRWQSLRYFVSNLFSTPYSKFHHNHTSVKEDYDKTF